MVRGILAGLAVGLIAAAPAAAESGNGLYEPFPSSQQAPSARSYYARLGLHVTTEQLRAGVFRDGFAAAPGDRAAGDRGGLGDPGLGLGALLGALGAAAIVVALPRLRLGT